MSNSPRELFTVETINDVTRGSQRRKEAIVTNSNGKEATIASVGLEMLAVGTPVWLSKNDRDVYVGGVKSVYRGLSKPGNYYETNN